MSYHDEHRSTDMASHDMAEIATFFIDARDADRLVRVRHVSGSPVYGVCGTVEEVDIQRQAVRLVERDDLGAFCEEFCWRFDEIAGYALVPERAEHVAGHADLVVKRWYGRVHRLFAYAETDDSGKGDLYVTVIRDIKSRRGGRVRAHEELLVAVTSPTPTTDWRELDRIAEDAIGEALAARSVRARLQRRAARVFAPTRGRS